jgi:hypothetical protein
VGPSAVRGRPRRFLLCFYCSAQRKPWSERDRRATTPKVSAV